jgi:hypothetical protein
MSECGTLFFAPNRVLYADAPAVGRGEVPTYVQRERGRDMKKLLKPAAIALLIFMIAFRPGESAQAVKNMVSVLGDAANGAVQFVTSVLA